MIRKYCRISFPSGIIQWIYWNHGYFISGKIIRIIKGKEMDKAKIYKTVIDIIVPFGRLLRRIEGESPFAGWKEVLTVSIPQSFFFYWLFSLIPSVGTLLYAAVFIPLSAWQHIVINKVNNRSDRFKVFLWYFIVILVGFGGLWNFIGHTLLADSVAAGIGWPTGSPFQIELAFYTLGSGIAALFAIWLRGHMITALVISKSIFWYGAAFVHIKDVVVNKNFSPLNIGSVLIGDIVFPTVFLVLLEKILKDELKRI
jgi:hypothetical protein